MGNAISLKEQIRRERGIFLKPCPNCGGVTETAYEHTGRGANRNYVYCTKCLANITGSLHETADDAARAWSL